MVFNKSGISTSTSLSDQSGVQEFRSQEKEEEEGRRKKNSFHQRPMTNDQ